MSKNLELEILQLASTAFQQLHSPVQFIPGESNIPVSGKVFGVEELVAATKASLEFWLTAGP